MALYSIVFQPLHAGALPSAGLGDSDSDILPQRAMEIIPTGWLSQFVSFGRAVHLWLHLSQALEATAAIFPQK